MIFKEQKGFTVAELIVTVTIIGILVVFILPMLTEVLLLMFEYIKSGFKYIISGFFWILVLSMVGLLLSKSFPMLKILVARASAEATKRTSGKGAKNASMVHCLHCGLYVPKHEAFSQGEKHFCSMEHAKQQLRQSKESNSIGYQVQTNQVFPSKK